MSYLLDTNIVSELVKRRKNAGVLDWFAATRSVDHYLSVLTVGELLRGVHRLRNRGDHQQADVLERAMTELRAEFAERIVRSHSTSRRSGRCNRCRDRSRSSTP